MASCKYYKQVRQVSYDSGVTWISLDEYQKGDLYENDSPDCGGGITQYRWVNVSGEYTCVGTTKYQKTKKQQSTDGGQTWTDVNPPEYSTGGVIERESSDCGGGSGYENQYLTLVAKGSGSIVLSATNETFQYSKDEGNTWATATSASTISVSNGDRVMFKGTLTPKPVSSTFGIGHFSASTQFEAEGNPMSLLFGDDFRGQASLSGKENAFANLFGGYSFITADYQLTSIDNLVLPATTLSQRCYDRMFINCRSLTSIPSNLLPATTLAKECYSSMFEDCTSLTSIPSNLLPATTMVDYCYYLMFNGCTSLTSIPSNLLPSTTLARYCYGQMFADCTSLTSVPSGLLPATTLARACYYEMFRNCTSLSSVPSNFLPATTLAAECYINMFEDCTSLATAPSLPATTLAAFCYDYMFVGCTSLTTPPSLPATTLEQGCYNHMFSNCTSLTTAPVLSAPTLEYRSYEGMFYNCSRLNYIKCLATDISATDCTAHWVTSVASSGTFVRPSSMSGWSRGVDGIPTNWTVQNA